MEFTIKQLFSVIDGRLSTEMEDVYNILNQATGDKLMTHQIPTAMKFLAKIKPKWFEKATSTIDATKIIVGDDFEELMKFIDGSLPNYTINVTTMDSSYREEYEKFMIDNSLLIKKANESNRD